MPRPKNTHKKSVEKQEATTNQSNLPKNEIEIKEWEKPLNDKQTIMLLNAFRSKIQNTQTYNRMGATQKAIVLEAVRFYVNYGIIKYGEFKRDDIDYFEFYFPFQVPGVNINITFIVEVKKDKFNVL